MSYLLSSLKNAEKQRKQNLCQNSIANLEEDESTAKQSSQVSVLNNSVSTLEDTDSSPKNLFLENSSNQFSTKTKLTYAFLISGICIVVILCMFWLYMLRNSSQDSKFIPDTLKGTVQTQDNLQLKLETELEFPVPTHKRQNQQHSATNKN
jgi:Flp pilus assembly protein TadB